MIIGVVGVVLGVVVLVVDDTKNVATYLGAFTMIVIGLAWSRPCCAPATR